jgi:hypothetical protein
MIGNDARAFPDVNGRVAIADMERWCTQLKMFVMSSDGPRPGHRCRCVFDELLGRVFGLAAGRKVNAWLARGWLRAVELDVRRLSATIERQKTSSSRCRGGVLEERHR